eukprot:TRINITY_DN64886_c0_g1_i1.p1 TRINITY_DN64886_c0_g1~~TRINITY_DN64886_c0_g1_i1.p1  ORF type:complete len:540 (+),score=151.71 TRINITY_DN64886_c0_g1_i1:74-1621(+)
MAAERWFEPCFVPPNFIPPAELRTEHMQLRMLGPADVEKDFEAVTSSLKSLRSVFAPSDTWPRDGITLEENRLDLARHQREFELRLAFAYTVFDSKNERCLGSVYVSPATRAGFAAECLLWVRDSERPALEAELEAACRAWLESRAWAEAFPAAAVCFPGRGEHSWDAFDALPWRDEDVPRIGADATTVVLHTARACGLAPEEPNAQGLAVRAVPSWLRGAWQRNYIARAGTDGARDSSVTVRYVQCGDGPFCDLRVSTASAARARARAAASAAACAAEDLPELAGSAECFAGIARGQRRGAAEACGAAERLAIWHAALHSDPLPDAPSVHWRQIDAGLHESEDVGVVEPQPGRPGAAWLEHGVGSRPEPGTGIVGYLEDWDRPQGATADEWWLAMRSDGQDGAGLFVAAGGWWGYFRDSRSDAARSAAAGRGLKEAAGDAALPLDVRRELVFGFECSVGRVPSAAGGAMTVEMSTLPWQEGVDLRPRLAEELPDWQRLGAGGESRLAAELRPGA